MESGKQFVIGRISNNNQDMSKKKRASHKAVSGKSASDTPDIDKSDIDTPDIDTPDIDKSDVDTPDVDPSANDTPDIDPSEIDMSEIDLPTGDAKPIIVGETDEIEAGDKNKKPPGDNINAGDNDETTDVLATDEDPVQIIDVPTGPVAETRAAKSIESEEESEPLTDQPVAAANEKPKQPRRGFPWFGVFNFLLIIVLAAAAYYYWREQQNLDSTYEARLIELQQQLDAGDQAVSKAVNSRLQSSLSPLESEMGSLKQKIDDLGLGQQDLRDSSEKLYILFGRDKNAWQLAEVEYLMRVAQHRLILQDDFEGAAVTLQAASDRLGLTGDPGMLPVRLTISEEIADLKTRRRADLVGMTLKLAQLGRQVRSLQPGFALRVDANEKPAATPRSPDDWLGQFNDFLNSLITIRKESSDPTAIEANIIDVAEALEDNLKLARWSVLERDAKQYQVLIDRSLQLFREFYDLDNAANQDFMSQLQDLQKRVIRPEKPDITGSLREMQRILSQRENAPPPAAPAQEPDNG